MFKLQPFPPYPEKTPELETIPLPAGLPAPVARYYKAIASDRLPVIKSAVLTGRARIRIRGLTFPSRFRFIHNAGQGYRHYIESTVLGFPVMKVNEYYLDGKGRMELPFGMVEGEAKIDMAANLGLWGESIWLPSIWITDTRVRWETINGTTALLVVPFGDQEDTLTIFFDPDTGLLQMMEAMRYREATDEEKISWRIGILGWQTFQGLRIPTSVSATWMDEGTPWAIFNAEDIAYNVDVSKTIRASGL